jgi:hypothetical protein
MRMLLLLLLAAQIPLLNASAADCLTIGVPAGAGASAEIMHIVQQIGQTAGICLNPLRAPRNRLDELAADGAVLPQPTAPGADSRLMALPTPLTTFVGSLYWSAGRPEPSGPNAVIGIVLGQDWAKRAAEARGATAYEVRDNKQLFDMMVAGRLDGMILPSISFRHFRHRYPALADCEMTPLQDLPMLFLLDRSHVAMAPSLDRAIGTLRRKGVIESEFSKYER